jgi:hypothetical protein
VFGKSPLPGGKVCFCFKQQGSIKFASFAGRFDMKGRRRGGAEPVRPKSSQQNSPLSSRRSVGRLFGPEEKLSRRFHRIPRATPCPTAKRRPECRRCMAFGGRNVGPYSENRRCRVGKFASASDNRGPLALPRLRVVLIRRKAAERFQAGRPAR